MTSKLDANQEAFLDWELMPEIEKRMKNMIKTEFNSLYMKNKRLLKEMENIYSEIVNIRNDIKNISEEINEKTSEMNFNLNNSFKNFKRELLEDNEFHETILEKLF